jgi:transcriptional regulator of aromatic amino acid metabolism
MDINGDFLATMVLPAIDSHNAARNDILFEIMKMIKVFSKTIYCGMGKDVQDLSSEIMRRFLDYDWPGNVRKLKNSIEYNRFRGFHFLQNWDIDLGYFLLRVSYPILRVYDCAKF